jgi:hypothetical protein
MSTMQVDLEPDVTAVWSIKWRPWQMLCHLKPTLSQVGSCDSQVFLEGHKPILYFALNRCMTRKKQGDLLTYLIEST